MAKLLLGFRFTRAAYGKRFYVLPRRLTLPHNPAIYRWGYWNFSAPWTQWQGGPR
jgi:hypothetical protein